MSDLYDRLEIKVVKARGLITLDGLLPSPYVEITCGQDAKRTRQITESQSPVWDAPMMIFSQLLISDISVISVHVKHRDVFTGHDRTLGILNLPMDTFYNAPMVCIDDWYPLAEGSGMESTADGEINLIISYFNVIDEDIHMDAQPDLPKHPNMLQVHPHRFLF